MILNKMLSVLMIILLVQTIARCEEDKDQCTKGHFKLKGMEKCHPYLHCGDLENMTLVRRIGSGAVKDVFLVSWENLSLALSLPLNPLMEDDFMNGVNILRLLNPSKYIVQYLGFCETKHALFTEYHANSDAFTLFNNSVKLSLLESIGFCHQYASILSYLHHSPAGTRVFCDSNSLEKLLSQLLVTFDLKLVLNDVDALPKVVNGSGVKCGHRQVFGTFVAPEQLWRSSKPFNDSLMMSYNEKTDIWKVPSVCEYFLKLSADGEILRYRLFQLHKSCKNLEPSKRPSMKDLVNEYKIIIEEFTNHSEL